MSKTELILPKMGESVAEATIIKWLKSEGDSIEIDESIVECKKILDGEHDGTMFEYETDGLIFTPCDKSIGSNKTGEITGPRKTTWPYSLKWKPPEYNTIDFLVSTKKNERKKISTFTTIYEVAKKQRSV